MNQCSQSFSQMCHEERLDSIPEFSRSDSIPLSKNRNNGTLNFHSKMRHLGWFIWSAWIAPVLSSSETVFFLGLGSWATISQDFLFSVAVLQLGRVWLSSSKSDSFLSFHALSKSESFSDQHWNFSSGWCNQVMFFFWLQIIESWISWVQSSL
jgi:hypothetical protein